MVYKKFENSDVFFNTIKMAPSFEIKLGADGNFYNGSPQDLYDINIDSEQNKHELLSYLSSDGVIFRESTEAQILQDKSGTLTKSLPLKAKVACTFFAENLSEDESTRLNIHSLKNILERKKIFSEHFSFKKQLSDTNVIWDKNVQAINLINIPSIFYGSSIKKGTVELSFYVTGSLVGTLKDIKNNGELIETVGSNTSSVAGVVLYDEGILLLTGSWNLNNHHTEEYIYTNTPQTDNPKWIYWGAGLNQETNLTTDSKFILKFDGTSYVNNLTMLAHAEKGDLNHSNNLTYIKHGEGDKYLPSIGPNSYKESEKLNIKNTVKYEYDNFSGSLEKQTFISKIAIYDINKNLIGIAKLAKPVRKSENRNFTFKLKLDI